MSPSVSPRAPFAGGRRLGALVRRLGWWGVGVLIVVGATLGTLRQQAQIDPLRPPQRPGELAWWLEPFQRNGVFSVANVGGSIDSIAALDGGERLWAIVSGELLVRSTTGGRGWSVVTYPRKPDTRIGAVFFVDADTGWLAAPGEILRTTDGGIAWERREIEARLAFDELQFVDRFRGWARTASGYFATEDGGATWREYRPAVASEKGNGSLAAVVRLVITRGGAGGCLLADGTVAVTRDFGATWTALPRIPDEMLPRDERRAVPEAPSGLMVVDSTEVPNAASPQQQQQMQVQQTAQQQQPLVQAPATLKTAAPPSIPGSDAIWPQRVLALEFAAEELVLTLDDGSAMTAALGDPAAVQWNRRPAVTGSPTFAKIVPVGGDASVAVTDDGAVMRILPAGIRLVLAGAGVGATLDISRDVAGRTMWWLAGQGGAILRSRDGGGSWLPLRSPMKSRVTSVEFVDASAGWIGGGGGELFRTRDGGETWTAVAAPRERAVNATYFRDAREGFVALESGVVLQTQDGGETWSEERIEGSGFAASALGPAAGGDVAAAGDGEETFRFAVADRRWIGGGVRLPHPEREYVYYRTFADGSTLALARLGRLLRSPGATQPLGARSEQALVAVEFEDDGRRGLGVTPHGAVLRTSDGGETWAVAHERALVLPAPWYWASWLVAGLCFWRAWRTGTVEHGRVVRSIAGKATPDAPIGTDDRDVLGLGQVARGLSRFFRNRATVGPFTVAVAGEWGSGKTSFMRLLREDLEAHDMRPVWFNAWHQQHEVHYLPALLDAIVSQAVPPIWMHSGWGFRARLIAARVWRMRVKIFWLAALATFFGSLLSRDDAAEIVGSVQDVAARAWNTVATTMGGEPADAAAISRAGETEAVKTTLLVGGATTSLLALLHVLFSTFKAFGVAPAQLLAKAASSRNRDVEARMSFQRRFARDFSEVTAALGAVPLVIFIDDLDRCRPEKTVEMLEAVNFLVASGGCFVVMGLAKAQVEACVGIGYKEISAELAAQMDGDSAAGADGQKERDERRAADERRKFARNYLEKLINLEIPIPPPTTTQRAELLSGRSMMPPTAPMRPARGWRAWLQALLERRAQVKRSVFGVALCASVLTLAWTGGQTIRPPQTKPSSAVVRSGEASASATTTTTTAEQSLASGAATSVRPNARRARDLPPAALHHAGADEGRSALVVLALLVAMASFAGLVAQRGATLTEDSPKFVDALEDWSPVIESSHATPRALKRFVNRVRYLAMQQTPEAQGASWQDRAVAWIATNVCKVPPTNPAAAADGIPEDFLVGLAAIDAFGVASGREVFGVENVQAAYALAKRHFQQEPGAPGFEQVYPPELMVRWRAAYLRLAAGAGMNTPVEGA